MSTVPSNGPTPSPTLRLDSQGYSQNSLGYEVPRGFTPALSQEDGNRRTAHLFTPLEMNEQQQLRLLRVLSNQGFPDGSQSQELYRQNSSPWQNSQPRYPDTENLPLQVVPQYSTQVSNLTGSPTKSMERQNSQRSSQ